VFTPFACSSLVAQSLAYHFGGGTAPVRVVGGYVGEQMVSSAATLGLSGGADVAFCTRAWCGKCYTPHPLDRFHVNLPQDEEGFAWLADDRDKLRFKQARNGDQFMTPFQCDWYLFHVVTGRVPRDLHRQDDFLLCLLRRCNLDAFWARETSTILANKRNLDQLIRTWDELVGIVPRLPLLGPFPLTDTCGIAVAVAMLVKFLQPGKYQDYTQFETLRKLQSAYSNFHHASAQGMASMILLGRDTSKAFLSSCPTNSLWFERFAQGCFRRMGQETHPDLALSIGVMLALLEILEKQWNDSPPLRETLAFLGAVCCIAYGGSFRGNEVFLTDLFGLCKYAKIQLEEGGIPYVIVPLLGRFKNEEGEMYHLTPLAAKTRSGIPVGVWVRTLVDTKLQHPHTHGPAFSDRNGKKLDSHWLELELMDRLHRIQLRSPELIPREVNVYEDYGISRLFRRGATTQAKNQRVSKEDIDAMNRWWTSETAQGRRPKKTTILTFVRWYLLCCGSQQHCDV